MLGSGTHERTPECSGDNPIEVVLLATELKASRKFYAEQLGLEVIRETSYAVWFKCGSEGAISISENTTGTADEQDQATFRVEDVRAEIAELRSRGVEILDYDIPRVRGLVLG
jgi:catechol 2,3-dioxygenase-like lactoylglutathione lyase family enzyme